ncbi:ABC transporter ATP-binding protein [Pseudoruegeria sp. SK021]|uniref:ABC transporter ATP-binding protein n=1 Tax=Pseudoruegeria sp. SK021 TaxID=1933035 RepID=UPI000A247037|nr:ABC transporter ATP-binding protein [Pseudoruegeria sp. SK021]OSP55879.1 ABC transporter ATP-binding protein [Pseudoruegeria sp. SK021]
MLEVSNIHSGYGRVQILFGASLTARPGEITCVMGRNGAGKTTAMKAIMGLLPLSQGTVSLDGEIISTLPAHEVPHRRIGYVPQGRRLFSDLSVAENIEVGLMTCKEGRATRDEVLDIFPRLRERLHQRAETLSGGEQQMLATARALCLRPRVLLLDEPTEGLQPSMIEAIRQVIVTLRDQGVAILLVEQRVDAVLAIADRVTFLENGRSADTVTVDALRATPDLMHRYLGV